MLFRSEVPCRVDRDGAHPLACDPLAPELLGLVQHVTTYEQLTIAAARTGSRRIARRALLAHPLIGQYEMAEALVEQLLAAHAPNLPRFANGGGE